MAEEQLDLQQGEKATRLKMGEQGYLGLRVSCDQIYEEAREELRWPRSIQTYYEMANDATIASALSLFEMMISRVEWTVKVNKDAPDQLKQRAKFVEQCMHDMEHSWFSFIKEVTSCFTYGFSVHEKVYRRRLKENGSKYNDGYIGFRKLPIRSQSTISKFKFDVNGRYLTHVIQDLNLIPDSTRYASLLQNNPLGELHIPRKKFLLFRTDVARDNPEGKSPLSKVYISWRYMQEIKEQEAIGISRDLAGMPTLYIPPRYMSADATPEEAGVYEYYKKVIRNIQLNEQSGLILPQMFDPESRQPLFKFELMGTTGGKSYNTNEIIQRYANEILQALFADLLKLGQDGVGSYSLADSKSSIMAMAIEARLKEIQDVLNMDLMRQLFEVNGWDVEELPTFEYGDLDEIDIDKFSQAVQRVKAVGMLAPTAGNVNYVAEVLHLPDRIDPTMTQDAINELLGPVESRSGDGLAKGAGNGTSDKVSSRDNSTANKEN
jgi:hypothetical protein